MSDITWSLISHTNIGKTTLARTLLRQEVGEVSDQAHVTDRSESHLLLETAQHRLILWDTPGFGDSARLLKRLRSESSPLTWLQSQVWDRITDRPLYCSQLAIRNVRDEADLILYLVSATETPEEAGYVPLEMELLSWTEVPVILLLNQTGESSSEALSEMIGRWEDASADWPSVKAVLPLDAHRRCWLEEGVLLQTAISVVRDGSKPVLEELSATWRRDARQQIDATVEALTDLIVELLHHREVFEGSSLSPGAKKAARERIKDQIEQRSRALLKRWIESHGLTGELAQKLESDWGQFVDSGETWLDEKRLGVSGIISGAATGALVDAKTLGATLGAGTMVGGILGGIAGWGLAGWISEKSAQGRHLRIGGEAMDSLLERLLFGLCVITHHGRGRGELRTPELALSWQSRVEEALAPSRERLSKLWERGKESGDQPAEETRRQLAPILKEIVERLLAGDSTVMKELIAQM